MALCGVDGLSPAAIMSVSHSTSNVWILRQQQQRWGGTNADCNIRRAAVVYQGTALPFNKLGVDPALAIALRGFQCRSQLSEKQGWFQGKSVCSKQGMDFVQAAASECQGYVCHCQAQGDSMHTKYGSCISIHARYMDPASCTDPVSAASSNLDSSWIQARIQPSTQ
jgi:hypothetical protein